MNPEKPSVPDRKQVEESPFSLPLEHYERLSSDELAVVAQRAGVTPERFLEIVTNAKENKQVEQERAKEAVDTDRKSPEKQETQSDFRVALDDVYKQYLFTPEGIAEEQERARELEKDLYDRIDKIPPHKRDLAHGAPEIRAIRRRLRQVLAAELTAHALELLPRYQRDLRKAIDAAATDFRARQWGRNIPLLGDSVAFDIQLVRNELHERVGFVEAARAYLGEEASPEQEHQLHQLRRAMQRGVNGGAVTDAMVTGHGIQGEFMRTIPHELLRAAQRAGRITAHDVDDSTGSAEHFGGSIGHRNYPRHSRPRRQNDELEGY